MKDNSPYEIATIASQPFQTIVKPFSLSTRVIFVLKRTLAPSHLGAYRQSESTWPGSENPIPGGLNGPILSKLARTGSRLYTKSAPGGRWCQDKNSFVGPIESATWPEVQAKTHFFGLTYIDHPPLVARSTELWSKQCLNLLPLPEEPPEPLPANSTW